MMHTKKNYAPQFKQKLQVRGLLRKRPRPYHNGEELAHKPLMERKAILEDAFTDSPKLAKTMHVDTRGGDFLELTKRQGLEGIVAKRKDSLYYFGKTTKDWIKLKNWIDEDFVACGYVPKEGSLVSLVLGQYQSDMLTYQGHVSLGVSKAEITRFQTTLICPFSQVPPGNEQAIWFSPLRTCAVIFMERTSAGGMRQPRLKAFREDKAPQDCLVQGVLANRI
jgi:ATP-dependent DNA ligase